MKIEYVNNEAIGGAGRKPSYPWAEFFEELYKDDSMTMWGMFPVLLKSKTPGAAYAAAKKFKDIKITCKNTDEGWIVFGQYQPGLWDKEENEEVF